MYEHSRTHCIGYIVTISVLFTSVLPRSVPEESLSNTIDDHSRALLIIVIVFDMVAFAIYHFLSKSCAEPAHVYTYVR